MERRAKNKFYYHKFYIQQPDLNWNNPAVQEGHVSGYPAASGMKRGVYGFRLDEIPTLYEAKDLRNMSSRPLAKKTASPKINAQGDPDLNRWPVDRQPAPGCTMLWKKKAAAAVWIR